MTKENKESTIAIRLTSEENEIIEGLAYLTGQSKSSFVRQLLRITINATKSNPQSMEQLESLKKGVNLSIENTKAN